MLRIRLTRQGAKKKPFYRIVVTERRSPRDGSFIQMLGYYNPRTEPVQVQLDIAAAEDWIRKGAQPSDTVGSLIKLAKERKASEPSVTALTPSPENKTVEPTS